MFGYLGVVFFTVLAVIIMLCICGYMQPCPALVACMFLSAICIAEMWLLDRERLSAEEAFKTYIRREFYDVKFGALAVIVVALTQIKRPERLLELVEEEESLPSVSSS